MKIVTKFKEVQMKIYNFLNRKGVVIALSALINIFYAFTLFFFILNPPINFIKAILEVLKETKFNLIIINTEMEYVLLSYVFYLLIILFIFVSNYAVRFSKDISELIIHLISKKRKMV